MSKCRHGIEQEWGIAYTGPCKDCEIERLRIDNHGLRKRHKDDRGRIEELEEQARLREIDFNNEFRGHHIPRDQIRAAWAEETRCQSDPTHKDTRRGMFLLAETLGIIRCEGCEGLGHYQEIKRHEWVDCPDCNGEGFVVE